MTCYYPQPAWKNKEPNEKTGRYSLTFSKKGSQIDPDYLIPCGKCIGCYADKAREWSIRIGNEAQLHKQNCFITLTYEDPPPEKIDKKELQDFFKRLRKNLAPEKIRYFACGEYGEQTRRPHYHAIIFGADFRGGSYPINDELYGNKYLENIWRRGSNDKTKRGNVIIAEANEATIAYVAGYCNKKIGDPDTFNLMSRRPGIGDKWRERYTETLARSECVVHSGREFPVPKFYLRKGGEDLDHIAANRQTLRPELTLDQLRAKEKNHKAKTKIYTAEKI